MRATRARPRTARADAWHRQRPTASSSNAGAVRPAGRAARRTGQSTGVTQVRHPAAGPAAHPADARRRHRTLRRAGTMAPLPRPDPRRHARPARPTTPTRSAHVTGRARAPPWLRHPRERVPLRQPAPPSKLPCARRTACGRGRAGFTGVSPAVNHQHVASYRPRSLGTEMVDICGGAVAWAARA